MSSVYVMKKTKNYIVVVVVLVTFDKGHQTKSQKYSCMLENDL